MSDTPTQSVFELVLARPVVTELTGPCDHPHLVYLWWRAPQQGDRVVQVYVNDQLDAVTLDPAQRELWLTLDRTSGGPQRIELLAVDADDPDALATPRPDLLTSWQPGVIDRASFTLIRDERLPVDTQIRVRLDGAVIDRAPLWPAHEHRGGFGALFGIGEFGRDAVTGPGLGLGELGMGPLGADGTAFRWSRGELPPGSHTLEIAALDETGQAAAPSVTLPVIQADTLPTAPRNLSISPDFTLTWNP